MIRYVYVAGPMAKGDYMGNIRRAIEMGENLLKKGYTPFIPHLDFIWDLSYPKPAEEWLQWDFMWLRRCDALIRLPGESVGADREVKLARSINIPVFYTPEDLQHENTSLADDSPHNDPRWKRKRYSVASTGIRASRKSRSKRSSRA